MEGTNDVTVNMICEYVWIDGGSPTKELRSKTRVFQTLESDLNRLMAELKAGKSPHESLPVWGFDGSSTNQAPSSDSDCVLKPVFLTTDPLAGANCFLVLCEVFNTSLEPHESNTRAPLRKALTEMNREFNPRVGFEQEYTLMNAANEKPIGWPEEGEPDPQGRYYCGVGGDRVVARNFAAQHLAACISAGVSVTGINAEVMLGQWEYQVGGLGVDALTACDHLWVSRYVMHRLSERSACHVSLDPKPVEGDWNGSGLHTNFSTASMRAEGGYEKIVDACERLSNVTEEHLDCYGDGYERRLTGSHETASYSEYTYGVSDRGASVRIPWQVKKEGRGYFEDRRPNSNADPYEVCLALVNTVCS